MNKLLRFFGIKKLKCVEGPAVKMLKPAMCYDSDDDTCSMQDDLTDVAKLEIVLPEYWDSYSDSSSSSSQEGNISQVIEGLTFKARPTSILTDDSPLEYSDDEDEEELDDTPEHEFRHPVEFSEDPEYRASEMLELAEEMVDHALRNMEQYQHLLDEYQLEQIEYSVERLNEFRERLDVFGNDSPIARLLRVELFIADAGDFLKRVILMVDSAQSRESSDNED